jgi:hypothetical protein
MSVIGLRSDFPELTSKASRCRACAMADTNPSALAVCHDLIRKGIITNEVVRRMKPVMLEAGLEPLSFRTIQNHASDHITVTMIADRFSGRKLMMAEEEKPVIPLMPRSDVVLDYQEMRKLYDKLVPILDMAYDLLEKSGEISGGDIITLVRVFGEARQQLEALGKMRNSDRLTLAILEWHTRAMAHNISEPLGRKLREIEADLEDGDAELAQAKLHTFLHKEIGPIFLAGARDALNKSSEEFKLPREGIR